VYLLSAVFDFENEFPMTGHVPPLVYNAHMCAVSVLRGLLGRERTEEERRRVHLSILAVCQDCEGIVIGDNLDLSDVARVLTRRLLRSSEVAEKPLASIARVFPRPTIEPPLFVPIEWIAIWEKHFGVDDELLRGAVRSAIPQHLLQCFAEVTPDGALRAARAIDDVVLQPGSILQPDVAVGSGSMLMVNAIALSGSDLKPNSFAPPNSVVVPDGEHRPIAETAAIEFPLAVKRGVTIAENVVVLRDCRIGSGSILRPGSFLGKRVRIGKGSVIAGGSFVPSDTHIPSGFTYRSGTIELSSTIPVVIWRSGNWFIRRESGFINLATVLAVCPSQFWECMELMRCFPRETGRQIALNCQIEMPLTTEKLFELFRVNVLSVCIEYWKGRQSPGTEAIEGVLREVTAVAVERFEDCFNDGRFQDRFEFLLHVCLNLRVLREMGIGEETVAALQKRIFEHADENMIRLALVKSPEATRMLPILDRLIEVSHFNYRVMA
jgi:carbonic anhydrase/acetyltransferase-like protein (isoleucine patch superfamily)